MSPGSAQADNAYESARDKAADKHFAAEFDCMWCYCVQSGEETCRECGEDIICPSCGSNDLCWHDDEEHHQCRQCNHAWEPK